MSNQVATIRKHLLKGNTITQRSALMDFGIMALPRRIADLKEQGFPVTSEMKINPNTGQRYASYWMDDEVTDVRQLKKGHVYRVHSVNNHPFAIDCWARSDGYFTVDAVICGGGADITMGGSPQFFSQEWLTDGDFKIKYIGGMA